MNLVAMGDIPALYAERLGRDHLCIVHQDDHLSWGDMATRVNRRASALKRLGIRKDDIVALVLPNENAVFELSRSEEHTSELQSLMRISYAVFCLKKKKKT